MCCASGGVVELSVGGGNDPPCVCVDLWGQSGTRTSRGTLGNQKRRAPPQQGEREVAAGSLGVCVVAEIMAAALILCCCCMCWVGGEVGLVNGARAEPLASSST